MTDESTMRVRLQQVAAYRELCRSVQRGGRENVVFALIMLGLAYLIYSGGGAANERAAILFGIIAAGELLVGLYKWFAPSAFGLFLDGVVMLVFAGLNGWFVYQRVQMGIGANPINVFFGLFMLFGAINRFKSYGTLRALFAERPDPEHMAWFDDLVREIRWSDPQTDQLALDLPTRPHWRAKLLGNTAFFVAVTGNGVWVAGPDDFVLRRDKADRGTGRRKALLSIHGEGYPEFEIADDSWNNYTRWIAGQGLPA
ncbi:MAG: hypothetical protein FJ304_26050 [Planctomycetes bacterium]|nr:hypothetical protein [Planctomycetota bacterium]